MENNTIKKRSLWADVWIRLSRNRTAVFGMCLFGLIVLACAASRIFMDFDTQIVAVDVVNQLSGPSIGYPFGRDELGRNIMNRILWGGGTTIFIAVIALCFAFFMGTVLGTVSAYYGRVTDSIIMRLIDIVMAIPPILLMITLATILTPSTPNLILVVGIGLIPNQSRMVRGQVLSVVDKEFIEASKIQGAGDFKIIMTHVLPNALSPIITTVILDIAYAVMVISTLSYLGLGIQAPNPEWGSMLAGGRGYIRYAWHISTFPGIILTLTIISLTLVGDGLRDALDPRMKR